LPVFDDVEPMLAGLRAMGCRLAVLTNCDEDLFAKTQRAFRERFDLVVTAERVRDYKPSPAHFRFFSRSSGVSASDWVHVACSWYHDIGPARELGINRVWLDRDGTGEDPATATVHVRSAADVCEAVAGVFQTGGSQLRSRIVGSAGVTAERTGAPALVIFDLGGTTIHDRGEVPAAFAAALEVSRIGFNRDDIASWRGASKREVLARLVARQYPSRPGDHRDAMVNETYELFRDALERQLRAAPDLAMADAAAVFARLKAAGIRIALNSGFDRPILETILSLTGWSDKVFDAVVCGDDVAAGRPSPLMIFRSMAQVGITDPRRVAVIGDTRLDLEAGANAGVAYRVGVLNGAHDRATLERGPFTHLVPSVGAVPDIWLRWRGLAPSGSL
jgi:phosphonatase-like hydrolase